MSLQRAFRLYAGGYLAMAAFMALVFGWEMALATALSGTTFLIFSLFVRESKATQARRRKRLSVAKHAERAKRSRRRRGHVHAVVLLAVVLFLAR